MVALCASARGAEKPVQASHAGRASRQMSFRRKDMAWYEAPEIFCRLG